MTEQESIALDRFWSKVEKSPTCWIWSASLDRYGYGQFSVGYRKIRAHRYAWEASNGAIPAGDFVLDHICRVRSCVNPAHLRLLSNRDNVAAGIGPTALNARKTHCSRGHEFDRTDTRGWRSCSTCKNESRRRRRALRRAVEEVPRG